MLIIYTYTKTFCGFGPFHNVDIPLIGLKYQDKKIFESILLNAIAIFILDMITFCIIFPFWFMYSFITAFIFMVILVSILYPITLVLNFIEETEFSILLYVNKLLYNLYQWLVQQKNTLFKKNN